VISNSNGSVRVGISGRESRKVGES